jgi:hypothetical protein
MTEDTQVLDPGLDPAEEPPAPQLPPGKPMKLPDTTRIQLIALAQAGLAVAIAFGVPISQEQSVALVALAGILGTVLITADASIRRERARNADKLRPVAQISGTMPSGDVASVRMPMAENATPAEAAATFEELVRSFELVSKFLEAEHARNEAENGAAAKAEPRPRRRPAAPRPHAGG